MRATWSASGSFDATLWEQRIARRVVPMPPGDHAPRTPMNHAVRTPLLERACNVLRARLNRLEDPPGPLTARQKRLLRHQTNRLSRLVEALIYASLRHEAERHAGHAA